MMPQMLIQIMAVPNQVEIIQVIPILWTLSLHIGEHTPIQILIWSIVVSGSGRHHSTDWLRAETLLKMLVAQIIPEYVTLRACNRSNIGISNRFFLLGFDYFFETETFFFFLKSLIM